MGKLLIGIFVSLQSILFVSYTFTCQHGQTECEGDIIHNCALDSIVSEKLR